jgi:TatD DNase family protein
MFVDTHCHLTDPKFNDLDVVGRAKEANVNRIISIACDLDDARATLAFADGESVWATAGFHPAYALGWRDDSLAELETLAQNPFVVAIGEIGLDYVYDDSNTHFPGATRKQQENVFEAQLDLASRLKLPVVIHNRDATERLLEILKVWREKISGGVFHCFGAGEEVARQVLDLDFHLGFGGLVTFKNAPLARESVKICPLNRILLETDAPYLAPVPYRGKTNESSFIPLIAQTIADIKGVGIEEIGETTSRNASNLFFDKH